jgi:catechol 2,3-dioxygenase-like lactoylglutathione lyase family enzyme
MQSRDERMWWGPAIEAPDPAALAAFYRELVGWAIVHEEPGTTVLGPPQGGVFVVFQRAESYEPPTWPPVDGRQRPMMHLDFQVADLDEAVRDAVAAGATLADHQPQPNVRVLFDPAGHPFCLCLDVD